MGWRELTDEQLWQRWGRSMASRDKQLDLLLRIHRERRRYSLPEQRHMFCVNEADYRRLRQMPLPRADQFVEDARRIALACNAANPDALVAALEYARMVMGRALDDSLPTEEIASSGSSIEGAAERSP